MNTVTKIHNSNSYDSFLYSENTGIGIKYFEEETKEDTDTLGHKVIMSVQKQQRLEEELRLLYVAMTRAEEKLIMIVSERNISKTVSKLSSRLLTCGEKINSRIFASATSMSDWILMTALLHPDCDELRKLIDIPVIPQRTESHLCSQIINAEDLKSAELNEENSDSASVIPDVNLELIKENIKYSYPYEPLIGIEAKSTVSVLANRAESERFAFSAIPSFMQKDGMSAAGKGTATHKIMQFINFTDSVNVDSEIERLVEWQFISENDAAAVDRDAVNKFFESNLYSRILKSDRYEKEMRFLTKIPAVKVSPELPENLQDENIMVQGAVDLCFIENGEVVIVDFKTDRVDREEQLVKAYSEQLNIYARACEKIFECKAKEKIIYSFALGKEISF